MLQGRRLGASEGRAHVLVPRGWARRGRVRWTHASIRQSWGQFGSISGDGRYVVFITDEYACSGNLTPSLSQPANVFRDVLVHDRLTGVTRKVSKAQSEQSNREVAGLPTASADGRVIVLGVACPRWQSDLARAASRLGDPRVRIRAPGGRFMTLRLGSRLSAPRRGRLAWKGKRSGFPRSSSPWCRRLSRSRFMMEPVGSCVKCPVAERLSLLAAPAMVPPSLEGRARRDSNPLLELRESRVLSLTPRARRHARPYGRTRALSSSGRVSKTGGRSR